MSTATSTQPPHPTADRTAVPHTDVDIIAPTVARLRETFESGRTRPYAWRKAQLERLVAMLSDRGDDFVAAMQADFGKPELEARAADVGQAKMEAAAMIKNLKDWMKPERVGLPIPLMGASRIVRDPLGVVLIISPWNYPVGLLLSPAAGAIAAGNAVVLKPSEVTPHTSAALARWVPEYLDPDAVALIEGGVGETTALLDERFDHIMYTGNGRVARVVMEAAAKHLTPVTLELGGKTPCIIDRDVDLEVPAQRIAWGKFMNAGQTCIAPDYVLVHEDRQEALIQKLQETVRRFYGDAPAETPDYARIVNRSHHQRLSTLLKGEDIAFGGEVDEDTCYIAPTVLRNVNPDSAVMQDEIFGPILPIVTIRDMDEAVDFVNERDKPLALYLFTEDRAVEDKVLGETSSGGACVNGTIMHISNPKLPFGGVGPSGMGAYHGHHTFDTFSHRKAVLTRGLRFDLTMMYPPYNGLMARLSKKLF